MSTGNFADIIFTADQTSEMDMRLEFIVGFETYDGRSTSINAYENDASVL